MVAVDDYCVVEHRRCFVALAKPYLGKSGLVFYPVIVTALNNRDCLSISFSLSKSIPVIPRQPTRLPTTNAVEINRRGLDVNT